MEHNNFNGTVCGLEMAKDMGVKGLEQKSYWRRNMLTWTRGWHVLLLSKIMPDLRLQSCKCSCQTSNFPKILTFHFETLHRKNRCLRHANVFLSRLSLKSYIWMLCGSIQISMVKVLARWKCIKLIKSQTTEEVSTSSIHKTYRLSMV
jgi:hypothetical protein